MLVSGLAVLVCAIALMVLPVTRTPSHAHQHQVWSLYDHNLAAFGTQRIASPALPFTPSGIVSTVGTGPVGELLTATFVDKQTGGFVDTSAFVSGDSPTADASANSQYIHLKWGIVALYERYRGLQTISWLYHGIAGRVASGKGSTRYEFQAHAFLTKQALVRIANSMIVYRPVERVNPTWLRDWNTISPVKVLMPKLPITATTIYSNAVTLPGHVKAFDGELYNEQSGQFVLLFLQQSRQWPPFVGVARWYTLGHGVKARWSRTGGLQSVSFVYKGVACTIESGRGRLYDGPIADTVALYPSVDALLRIADSMIPS